MYFCTHVFDTEIKSPDVLQHVRSAAKNMAPLKVFETVRTLRQTVGRCDPDQVTKTAADTVMEAVRKESERLDKRIESQNARLAVVQTKKQEVLERFLPLKEC